MPPTSRRPQVTTLEMALQGGGAHGAFTWGVLDRLLDEPGLQVAGISGTSAGAMNAVVLASGMLSAGRQGARQALTRFWQSVADIGPFSPMPWRAAYTDAAPHPDWWSPWLDLWNEPLQAWMTMAQESWRRLSGRDPSPYEFNPLALNPLRHLLTHQVDFEALRASDDIQLFIAATQVRTGGLRLFRRPELSADVVMASACLPLAFQAVEIDGEAYWDGGYAGNPSLLPLILECPADDLVLVQLNPRLREALPTRTQDILDRMNEVTFNASLIKELRSIALLKRALATHRAPKTRGKAAPRPSQPALFERVEALRIHRIDGERRLSDLGASSKLDTRRVFLERLHQVGIEAAEHWLRDHRADLGRRSTISLDEELPT